MVGRQGPTSAWTIFIPGFSGIAKARPTTKLHSVIQEFDLFVEAIGECRSFVLGATLMSLARSQKGIDVRWTASDFTGRSECLGRVPEDRSCWRGAM